MGKVLKRAAVSTAALVAAATAVVGAGAGSAQASEVIALGNTYSAGVYSSPSASSAKVAGVADLHPGDSVAVNCWTVGTNVGNFGNVWYHAFQEIYAGSPYLQVGGWVFAPYVDGAAAFHSGAIPKCP